MTLDEQISFCEEKSKNIKLKTEPQTFVDIKNSLEKLKGQWIPCSERLPEENTKIIVCFAHGLVTALGFWDGLFHGVYDYTTEVVIAWMPLPEPYRESEE